MDHKVHDAEIDGLASTAQALLVRLRAAASARGGRGPIPHALNVAATHTQDALGALIIAQQGGSPGVS